MSRLQGRRIALLIEDGFDLLELNGTVEALRREDAEVVTLGPSATGAYRDKTGAHTLTANRTAGSARMTEFDALVIPGGYAPDRMRMRHAMVDLVAAAVANGTPVAAMGHGAQLLISANVVRGRTLTCWPSIAIDIKNAGGLYVDRPVVRDGPVITSRKIDDMEAFCRAIGDAIVERGSP